MQACINKIHQVGGAARLLNKKPDNSWNQIAEEFGLSPSLSNTVQYLSFFGGKPSFDFFGGEPSFTSLVNPASPSSLGSQSSSPPQRQWIPHRIL